MYMGLIVVWSAPILAIQWLYGGSTLVRDLHLWLPAVLLPTVYLWITDHIAISDGIWWIADDFTLGLHLPLLTAVPVEEATFFLLTNLMCVQGVWLFIDGLATI